ncbi:MAG TPA: hypothetical protein VJL80_13740 [Aeromicrobium sp.]|nr:hypothetical protein [Aeromicrobium sp.]HKY59097.1 hypothetical protein [Aeromicrobium sp.]
MRSLVVTACIGLVALSGCESGRSPINPPPSSGATAAPSAPVEPTAPSTSDATSSGLLLAPGKAGPFTIGMTSEQALKDGLVREPGDSECGLTPVGSYRDFSVQFADTETGDVLFGVLIKNKEAATAEGISVGDSIAELKETYGAKLKRTTGEFGETHYVMTEANKAIGFTEGDGDDAGKIFAIDVFQADSPVIWDGC